MSASLVSLMPVGEDKIHGKWIGMVLAIPERWWPINVSSSTLADNSSQSKKGSSSAAIFVNERRAFELEANHIQYKQNIQYHLIRLTTKENYDQP